METDFFFPALHKDVDDPIKTGGGLPGVGPDGKTPPRRDTDDPIKTGGGLPKDGPEGKP